jgi:lactoylglutathione lyase
MKLNHLNLSVTDVRETKAFLANYFQLEDGGGNANIGFLRDDNGMVLTLTSMKVGGESDVRYPATFHIGFIQENEEKVNSIHAQLVADGFNPPAPSRQHGSWTFYFAAPGGFVIEVLS